jgi:hypothetical protein
MKDIIIKGARQHNFKNISAPDPLGRLREHKPVHRQ